MGVGSTALALRFRTYSPPEVDRIWLWVYANKIPIAHILSTNLRVIVGVGTSALQNRQELSLLTLNNPHTLMLQVVFVRASCIIGGPPTPKPSTKPVGGGENWANGWRPCL